MYDAWQDGDDGGNYGNKYKLYFLETLSFHGNTMLRPQQAKYGNVKVIYFLKTRQIQRQLKPIYEEISETNKRKKSHLKNYLHV